MRWCFLPFLLGCLLNASCAYQVVAPNPVSMSDDRRLTVAQTHILLGQWTLAKKQLDQVSSPHQNQAYWRLLGLYWLSVGNDDEALLVHKKALAHYPLDDFILNNYGVLLGLNDRWEDACGAFRRADKVGHPKRQSVQINLSRCGLRQKRVKLAEIHLKQAKEIDDLPLIGLMTELNLVLIQGNYDQARLILNNIQAHKEIARGSEHFNEYNCLSWHLSEHETDPTLYSFASDFTCLNGSRY